MWSGLGSADRSLHSATREGREVRVLVLEKQYDAPQAEVWHAVTTADRVARWLGPVSGDLRPGGRFQVEGNAGGTVLRVYSTEWLGPLLALLAVTLALALALREGFALPR